MQIINEDPKNSKDQGRVIRGVSSLHLEEIFALDLHVIRSVPMGCLMLGWTGSNITVHNTAYTGSGVVTVCGVTGIPQTVWKLL